MYGSNMANFQVMVLRCASVDMNRSGGSLATVGPNLRIWIRYNVVQGRAKGWSACGGGTRKCFRRGDAMSFRTDYILTKAASRSRG